MNSAFTALLNEKIELFKYSFSSAARQTFVEPSSGRLRHAGEFGTYREEQLRKFLQLCVPSRLQIGTGFLMSASDDVSTQIDIVIYEPSATPRIESNENQRFFAIEGVCAIGELKSTLTKSTLRDALNKLARAKAIGDKASSHTRIHRNEIAKKTEFNRETIIYDQLVSFLICEKLDFDYKSLLAQDIYDKDIKNHHKHNLILSVEDGLILYVDDAEKSWMYPPSDMFPCRNRLIEPTQDGLSHFHLFCAYMFMLTSQATILFPEFTQYMPQTVGLAYDEIHQKI